MRGRVAFSHAPCPSFKSLSIGFGSSSLSKGEQQFHVDFVATGNWHLGPLTGTKPLESGPSGQIDDVEAAETWATYRACHSRRACRNAPATHLAGQPPSGTGSRGAWDSINVRAFKKATALYLRLLSFVLLRL